MDSGYDFSVYLTAPPGDTHRTIVIERGGKIWLLKDGVRQPNPFLDLTSLTGQGHEYGVYTLAFHPQYAQNRRLFVYYVDNGANTRVVEYQANSDFDTADPASRKVILGQAQSATAVLYGGMIAFGPDGKLYISLGATGTWAGVRPAMRQDSTSLLGKILRLDVDGAAPYVIPADNPYVGRPGWRRRSGSSASAIRGAGASTAPTETSTSAMWERTCGRRLIMSRHPSWAATTSAGRSRKEKLFPAEYQLFHPRPGRSRCSSIRTDSPAR